MTDSNLDRIKKILAKFRDRIETEDDDYHYDAQLEAEKQLADLDKLPQPREGHVKLADDQKLPTDLTNTGAVFVLEKEKQAFNTGYFACGQDMLKVGFRKVTEDEAIREERICPECKGTGKGERKMTDKWKAVRVEPKRKVKLLPIIPVKQPLIKPEYFGRIIK